MKSMLLMNHIHPPRHGVGLVKGHRLATDPHPLRVASMERRRGRLDDWILVLARREPPR